MKTFVIIFSMVIISCQFDKKKQNEPIPYAQSSIVKIDTTLIYNHILNDLVEHHLYNKYLGDKGETLFIDLIKKRIDSMVYSEKLNTLKNNIVNNDSLKGNLYVNDNFEGYKKEIKYLNFPEEFDVDEVMLTISKKNRLQIDSLKSNFVTLKRLSDKKFDNSGLFEVGVISLSKFIFNQDKTKGMLYFEFVCGGKCGEGSLILIKKINGNWKINKKYTLWEI